MYLESLIRLAEIVDHFKENDEKLISNDFHDKTVELIEAQSKFLVTELEFKQQNPGPYSFGFGDLELTIYSPDQTDIQEWAALCRKGTWQKAYRFNSIMGLVKVLVSCINDSEEDDLKNKKDGSTNS